MNTYVDKNRYVFAVDECANENHTYIHKNTYEHTNKYVNKNRYAVAMYE